jgi:hypothetical protein
MSLSSLYLWGEPTLIQIKETPNHAAIVRAENVKSE